MIEITHFTFHLQPWNRCGTDDQAETGPESESAPGRNRPRNHVHTDEFTFVAQISSQELANRTRALDPQDARACYALMMIRRCIHSTLELK